MDPLVYIDTKGRRLHPAAIDALETARAQGAPAVLLVPRARGTIHYQKALASRGLGVGVGVYSVQGWLSGLWSRFGDGTQVADRLMVHTAAMMAVPTAEGTAGAAGTHRGDATLVARLLQSAGPLLVRGAPVLETLSRGQRQAVEWAFVTRELLAQRNLVCSSDILAPLTRALAELPEKSRPHVVFSGFDTVDKPTQWLIEGLSRSCPVTVVLRGAPGPAGLTARAGAEVLGADPAQAMEAAEKLAGQTVPDDRPAELQGLLDDLFRPDGTDGLEATGAVELWEAAGPEAEAELVAEGLQSLVAQGLSPVVAATDTTRWWRILSPKLHGRDIPFEATVTTSLDRTRGGSTFLALLETVVALRRAQADWPPEGTEEMGDMAWWPPEAVIDFLEGPLGRMGHATPWRLDARWRGDRILKPGDVLESLHRLARSESLPHLDRALTMVEKGYIGGAADELTEHLRQKEVREDDEAFGVLGAVRRAADAMAAMAMDPTDLPLVVSTLKGLMASLALTRTVEVGLTGDGPRVRLMGLDEVAAMEPGEADALVWCGLTTGELPLTPDDSALHRLLVDLGASREEDMVVRARCRTWHALDAVDRRVVLERSLTDGSDTTFPAVMLTEILACYGSETPAVTRERSEWPFCENLSPDGTRPPSLGVADPAAPDQLAGPMKPFIVTPRSGVTADEAGRPMLSASQIESYLECPCKWFTLRRLKLGGIDAGFSGLEKGSFAHRVMELTHRSMAEEAAAAAGTTLDADPRRPIPGSRVDANDLEAYLERMDAMFDEHYAHQFHHGSRLADQALIPHDAQERFGLMELKEDLAGTLRAEADLFAGFEPRWFELPFGREGYVMDYGGVTVLGTVDRVDVDDGGRALIIDYKTKKHLAREYALATEETDLDSWVPRHCQTLIYASVFQKLHPELEVVGALYLGLKDPHELTGAVDPPLVDRVLGPGASKRSAAGVSSTILGARFGEVLERCETVVAAAMERLVAGDIEARPVDAAACAFCPVTFCERRLS